MPTTSASPSRSPTTCSTSRATSRRWARRSRKDADAGKATFVSLLGVDGARKKANALVDEAVGHLSGFDERADLLRQTARFVVDRRN